MALEREIWINDIQETLYVGSEFINLSTNHDQFIANKTVHLPQAGSPPAVQVNRAVLPAVIGQRTDSDNSYSMDEFTTDPILIRNIEELQISYDKRGSVMNSHYEVLRQSVGNKVAYNWTPQGVDSIIRTTGDNTGALPPGATGTRKAVTIADIIALASRMDTMGVPQANRYLMLPGAMFWELLSISDVLKASYNGFSGNQSVLATGVVAELMGFKLLKREAVNIWSNATPPVLKAIGAASAASDNYGAIAWHPSYVAKAQGDIKIFSDSGDNGEGKPEYYGIILSALVMMGAARLRTDGKGILNLVQAHGA